MANKTRITTLRQDTNVKTTDSPEEKRRKYNLQKQYLDEDIDIEENYLSQIEDELSTTRACYNKLEEILRDDLNPKIYIKVNAYNLNEDWKGKTYSNENTKRTNTVGYIGSYKDEIRSLQREMSESIECLEAKKTLSEDTIEKHKLSKENVNNILKNLKA